MNKYDLSFLLLFAMTLLIGCGDDTKLEKVSGTVSYAGMPLSGASVVFLPVASDGYLATGTTDEKGHYLLSAPRKTRGIGQGALAGEYRVVISCREIIPDPDQLAYEQGSITYAELQVRHRKNAGRRPKARSLIPERYASSDSSGLLAAVESGKTNEIDFELEK